MRVAAKQPEEVNRVVLHSKNYIGMGFALRSIREFA